MSTPHPELRLARFAAAALAVGFGFGGLVGIINSAQPVIHRLVALALLIALVVLHLRNCVRPVDGSRPAAWRWSVAVQALLTGVGMIWFADTWYGNSGFLAAAVLLLIRPPSLAWAGFGLVVVAQFAAALPVRPIGRRGPLSRGGPHGLRRHRAVRGCPPGRPGRRPARDQAGVGRGGGGPATPGVRA